MATASTFVLVHSPLVGPKTWEGVAAEFADRVRVAAEAEAYGWRVEHLPGSHLHAVTNPGEVAEELLSLTR